MGNKYIAFLFVIAQMCISINLYGADSSNNTSTIYVDINSSDISSVLKQYYSRGLPQDVNDYDYGNFEDLTLEISTDIKEIIPIEPLPVTITIINKTDKIIKAFSVAIDPSFGLTRFYVSKENQPFEVFSASDWLLESIFRLECSLKPDFKYSVDRYLFYANPKDFDKNKRGQYLFEEPGHYRIKAIYTDSKIGKKIESNTLSINVIKPAGEDSAAYQFIKNMQDDENKKVYYGNFLLWPIGGSEIREKQKEFIEKFPDNKYSRYLYYTIGKRSISKDSQKLKLGINYLEKAASFEDFLFAEDSILKLIQIFTETDQPDKAREYKEILAKRFPHSHEGKNYVGEVLGYTPKTFKYPVPAKKPLGVALPIAGATVAIIAIAGLILFSRKKKLEK